MLNGERLWRSVQTLGEIGERDDGAMMRVTGSEADGRARDTLVEWFEDAGLDVSVDPVGNVVARRPGRTDAAPVVTGSHVDTVPAGGRFDGTVGVLGPLEVVRAWNDADVTTDRPLEIVVFTEEEGTRFGVGLLGSLVATGALDAEEALALTDDDGRTLAGTLDDIGYRGSAAFSLDDAAAFVEMHVEQGPELDGSGVPVGVVESIAGITHHAVRFEGEADHAGNTPMAVRRDAFMGAAEFALELERLVTDAGDETVGTVGKVAVSPNGTNVIPGEVSLGVDVRDTDGDRLDGVVADLKAETTDIAGRRDLAVDWETLIDVTPREMDRDVLSRLEAAAEQCGLDYRRMRSGAGHDAMNVATVAPTGMLFVPSVDGVSHSPEEYTSPDDLLEGTRVLEAALRSLATVESRPEV